MTSKSITETHQHLIAGDFSARELTEAFLSNIEKKNPEIHAYLEVFDDVLQQAEEADKRLQTKDNVTVLTGIPIAVKDNIMIEGKRATAASKMLEPYVATYDATIIRTLKEGGALFLGRTNMDEFAMGSSTEHSAFGVTKNPHDTTRVPGGSSGGSAAAVAMEGALAALGSDTGGSVRQPAAFCGVVGLKPTYGALSRHGLMAMGSSLDQIGPLTNTVGDAEILFNALQGRDTMDSTTLFDTTEIKSDNTKKPIIGVPRKMLEKGVDEKVMSLFEKKLTLCRELGFEVKDIELPNIAFSLPVYYIIMPAEVSTNLARYDGTRYGLYNDEKKNLWADISSSRGFGFGTEVRRRIILGTYILSAGYYDAFYKRANDVRQLIIADFRKVFQEVDVIATPTAPTPAFKIGQKTSDPLQMYLEDVFTVPANIAGIPAISLPIGTVVEADTALPVGMQLMAAHRAENILFAVGKQILGESS